MATVIRMQRGGRTHKPYYRIVVMDSRSRTRGVEVDTLGIYHPCARPEPVAEVDTHKALEWLGKGAQPSDTARSVLKKLGVMKHFHDGTKPEEAVGTHKSEVVADKGYNAPPPPKVEAPEPEVEAVAEEATEEVVEEAAVAEEATTEEAPAEEATDSEEKAE